MNYIDKLLLFQEYQDGEIYKQILGENDTRYFISNYGNVLSLCGDTAKILKPQYHSGYAYIDIDGRHTDIHRLVALAFCKNNDRQNKTIVHHKDNNRQNNKAENLSWCSPAEHIQIHCEMRKQEQEKKQEKQGNGCS